jgi:predicted transcriptional regulator
VTKFSAILADTGFGRSRGVSSPPRPAPLFSEAANDAPPAVRKLAPRERMVALQVYGKGALTAAEICAELSPAISNGAVRVMLGRLVAKGILERRPSGYGKTFLYVPRAGDAKVAEIAFKRLSEDFFGGSYVNAASAILAYLSADYPKRPGSTAF